MNRSRFKNPPHISDKELELLEVIKNLGPCSSQQVYETLGSKSEYLLLMRSLHILVEKGLLQRITIDKKLLYRTARNYRSMIAFLVDRNA